MAITLSSNVNNNIPGVAPNDIYLDSLGNIALAYDLEAILQECTQAGRTLLGECIFDTTIGIPYEQVVWVGVPNISQFIGALRQAFLNVAGVLEVVSLIVSQTNEPNSSSQSADMLTYTAIIRTIYGSGAING